MIQNRGVAHPTDDVQDWHTSLYIEDLEKRIERLEKERVELFDRARESDRIVRNAQNLLNAILAYNKETK